MAKRIVIMWHCRLRHHSSQALIASSIARWWNAERRRRVLLARSTLTARPKQLCCSALLCAVASFRQRISDPRRWKQTQHPGEMCCARS
jgi:hypothetical protein